MFQLSWEQAECSRSQIVTLIDGGVRGKNIKYRPFAFTEQGVAMLSSVLKSERAVQVNVEIMRAFVRLRGLIGTIGSWRAGSMRSSRNTIVSSKSSSTPSGS